MTVQRVTMPVPFTSPEYQLFPATSHDNPLLRRKALSSQPRRVAAQRNREPFGHVAQ